MPVHGSAGVLFPTFSALLIGVGAELSQQDWTNRKTLLALNTYQPVTVRMAFGQEHQFYRFISKNR